MFEKLGQLKDLWKLKSQMEELKKRLDGMVVKVEGPKHWVEITISGSQEIKEVKIFDIAKEATPAELGEEIKAGPSYGRYGRLEYAAGVKPMHPALGKEPAL